MSIKNKYKILYIGIKTVVDRMDTDIRNLEEYKNHECEIGSARYMNVICRIDELTPYRDYINEILEDVK